MEIKTEMDTDIYAQPIKGMALCDKCDYFLTVEEAYNKGHEDALNDEFAVRDAYDNGYQQGRAEAIKEFAKALINYRSTDERYKSFEDAVNEVAKQIKEQTNE